MILDRILEYKRQEVAAAKSNLPLEVLKDKVDGLPSTRGFARSLRQRSEGGTAIIAEVKKGSPSKGVIRSDFDPVEIALSYQKGGAACLSVLTDSKFFLGDLSYLSQIADVVDLPLLRKDFVIDPYQIFEARMNRADAILLIAAALELETMKSFAALASELGLDVLLEVHNEQELEEALQVPVELIGINNRDLRTFKTDIAVTKRLIPMIPDDRLVVSESGINSRGDIVDLEAAGCRAFLIGESLMRENDIEGKLISLLQD